jgi:hypothetical protein
MGSLKNMISDEDSHGRSLFSHTGFHTMISSSALPAESILL